MAEYISPALAITKAAGKTGSILLKQLPGSKLNEGFDNLSIIISLVQQHRDILPEAVIKELTIHYDLILKLGNDLKQKHRLPLSLNPAFIRDTHTFCKDCTNLAKVARTSSDAAKRQELNRPPMANKGPLNREALSDEEMHRIAQAIITILADELTRHGLYNPSPALSCVQEETLSDIEDLSANDTGSGDKETKSETLEHRLEDNLSPKNISALLPAPRDPCSGEKFPDTPECVPLLINIDIGSRGSLSD